MYLYPDFDLCIEKDRFLHKIDNIYEMLMITILIQKIPTPAHEGVLFEIMNLIIF